MSVGEYVGHKVSNDFLPMLARQMVIDQPDYATFFTFHDEATKKALDRRRGRLRYKYLIRLSRRQGGRTGKRKNPPHGCKPSAKGS
jgi:hypothetical protein